MPHIIPARPAVFQTGDTFPGVEESPKPGPRPLKVKASAGPATRAARNKNSRRASAPPCSIPRDAPAPRGALAGSNPTALPKNCQAFPPRYESVPPHSTTLPRPTSPTNLANYIAQLGILKIGAKKSLPPRRDPERGRRERPFLLSERRSSMPPSVPCAITLTQDLGTAPRRRSRCCQTCQQMQAPQNQLPVTCPPWENTNRPTKGAQQAKPRSPAHPAARQVRPRHSAAAKTNWNP